MKFKIQIQIQTILLHYNVLHSQTEFDPPIWQSPVTDHSLLSDQLFTNTPSLKGNPMHDYM